MSVSVLKQGNKIVENLLREKQSRDEALQSYTLDELWAAAEELGPVDVDNMFGTRIVSIKVSERLETESLLVAKYKLRASGDVRIGIVGAIREALRIVEAYKDEY